ncbi:MAG: plastocyanin/azurin family copper-binding protein [Roseovarius sp.]|nr:plastocyanin/azurin family copper-binding protein [Roseovarius sp.]
MQPYRTTLASVAFALATSAAFAGAGHDSGHGGGHAAMMGAPGDPAKADRVIEVSMTEMAYEPSNIEVMEGETITFVVRNDGDLVHEFNLGTQQKWQGHMDEMMKMMETGMMTVDKVNHDKMMQAGMMHDDPNSVLLEPGQTAKVTWTFGETADMGFACNVPGHREAGMVGDIVFKGH